MLINKNFNHPFSREIPDWDTLEAESTRARDAQREALSAGAT